MNRRAAAERDDSQNRSDSLTKGEPVVFGDRPVKTPIGPNANPLGQAQIQTDTQLRVSNTQSNAADSKMKPMIRRKDGTRTAAAPVPNRSMSLKGISAKATDKDDKPKFNNLAEKFLLHSEIEQKEVENANRLKMKMINDEMRDMLMMAKDTRGAIKEMNAAFAGYQEVDYVAEVRNKKTKVKKVTRHKTVDR
jgi:hypothetical protein